MDSISVQYGHNVTDARAMLFTLLYNRLAEDKLCLIGEFKTFSDVRNPNSPIPKLISV